MDCQLKYTNRRQGDRFVVKCTECEAEYLSRKQVPTMRVNCKKVGIDTPGPLLLAPPPPSGPGTELKRLFQEYGIRPKSGCGCDQMIKQMDAWGTQGCADHREEILAHLKDAYDMASFYEKTKAAALAWLKGLPMSLEGCVDESILRHKAECEAAIQEADAYLGANP